MQQPNDNENFRHRNFTPQNPPSYKNWLEGASGVRGILARLWRKILIEKPIGIAVMEKNLTAYVNRSKRSITDHRVSKHLTRGHLRRQLEKGTMTIKVFNKGLQVIGVKRVRYMVELTHADGRTTWHEETVDLGSISPAELDRDEDETPEPNNPPAPTQPPTTP